MQRKPEDRVLPYNSQNMLDTNKTKAFDIITSVYMFQKQFRIITINHRRHGCNDPDFVDFGYRHKLNDD